MNRPRPTSSPLDPLRLFGVTLTCLAGLAVQAFASDVTVLGPKRYVRQPGAPTVVTDTFAAARGAATIEINNGTLAGGSRVSSAAIVLNGRQILGPADFNQRRFNFQVPVRLEATNTLSVSIRSAPGSYLAIRVVQDAVFTTPFREDVPAWAHPDLAVSSLTVEPDRCDPGQQVAFRAVVANIGTAPAGSAEVAFEIDGQVVARVPIDSLGSGVVKTVSATWTAAGPGRHEVTAALLFPPDGIDRSAHNDWARGAVRVSGLPLAEVEYTVESDPGPPVPGEPATFSVEVRNAGFTTLADLHVGLYLDDVPLPAQAGPSAAATSVPRLDALPCPPLADSCYRPDVIIPVLDAGERTRVKFVWAAAAPGEFVVKVRSFTPAAEVTLVGALFTAFLPIADTTTLYDGSLPDQWTSLGPTIIAQTGAGGRMDSIAVHAASGRIYASSPFTGVWRLDPGGAWQPKGDKLARTVIPTVAVDPGNADVVYAAAADWNRPADMIIKSVDGGTTWRPFTTGLPGHVRKLVVRRTASGGVLMYAATTGGVLRYCASDPLQVSAPAPDWYTSVTGNIWDMVVHPTVPGIVYVVRLAPFKKVAANGAEQTLDLPLDIMRTGNGQTGTQGNLDWTDVSPFAFGGSLSSVTIDLSRSKPTFLFAALLHPPTSGKPAGYLLVYSSQNEGTGGTWSFEFQRDGSDAESYYNPFIRVHAKYPNIVYYGGIKLYRAASTMFGWYSEKVPTVHDDQRELQFAPNGDDYFALTDGGLFLGNIGSNTGFDVMTSLNQGLRTHLIHDFDVSPSDPSIMIAGTQDNGTIRYLPDLSWKELRGGDGLASLIAPGKNQVMYSQHQFLFDTRRSDDGGATWASYPDSSIVGLKETPGAGTIDTKFLAVDPGSTAHIMAPGLTTQVSFDSGRTWAPDPYLDDPLNGVLNGQVTHFQFLWDGSNYLFGTDQGQVWFRKSAGGGGIWILDDVPGTTVKRVVRAPASSTLAFVLAERRADQRIKRFSYDGLFGAWSMQNMTGDLPVVHLFGNADFKLNAIAADPCGSANVVYVGTDKGVFRGELGISDYAWKPYNLGLPLVPVTKLIPISGTGELRAATYGRGVWSVKTSCSW